MSAIGREISVERAEMYEEAKDAAVAVIISAIEHRYPSRFDARIDAMRPAGAEPIQVIQRIFTEPPFVVPGLAALTIDQMCDAVRSAKAAGIAHVVVDTGFTTQVTNDQDWAGFPDRLAPLLDAAND